MIGVDEVFDFENDMASVDTDVSNCPYCGEPFFVEVFEVWDDRNFVLDTCCEFAYQETLEECRVSAGILRDLTGRIEILRRAIREIDSQIIGYQNAFRGLQGRSSLLLPAEKGKIARVNQTLQSLQQERTVLERDLRAARKELQDEQSSIRRYWRDIFQRAGLDIRQVIVDSDESGSWIVDWGLSVRSVEQKLAKEFIQRHHRHNPPPPGWLFGLGCYNGPDLVAVAWVGRPVSRILDRTGERIEVNRLCVNPELEPGLTWNACSLLYAECAKRAKLLRNRMGERYRIIQTYTLESESGVSLRAAGWTPVYKNKGGAWTRTSRPRANSLPTESKIRWEKPLC